MTSFSAEHRRQGLRHSSELRADMDIVSLPPRVKKRANLGDPRESLLINDTFPPYFAKDRFNVAVPVETIPDGEEEDGRV